MPSNQLRKSGLVALGQKAFQKLAIRNVSTPVKGGLLQKAGKPERLDCRHGFSLKGPLRMGRLFFILQCPEPQDLIQNFFEVSWQQTAGRSRKTKAKSAGNREFA
jgi:hypothetical protein